MKTEGLIEARAAVHFRGWSVDEGPADWTDRDVWTEIADYLNVNDVRSAAALLRHFLEFTAAELCHRLRAPVEFRGDYRYQLGALLPAAVSQLRKQFTNAAKVASSWNQKALAEELEQRARMFSQVVADSNVEQWQINVAVHFNAWDNLSKADFGPVVTAFQHLLRGFTCSACGEYLRVSPELASFESLRCDCGQTNINLVKKGA
jgi:hypothetical protein